MSRDVLVKRVVRDASGKPSYMYGLDGGSQGPSRRSSKREMAGSALGGAVGVLSALTGQHRSLGSLINSGVIGMQQGAGLGRRIGSMATGAGRKAELQQIQAIKDENARQKGRKRLEDRVERANEAADIRATRGSREGRMADTRGPVRQARDAIAVMRTPASIRNPVNEAKALREQQEQLQATDAKALQLAQQMAANGTSPEQISALLKIPPETVQRLIAAIAPGPLTQVGGPAPSGPVEPLRHSGGAPEQLQEGDQTPPYATDNITGTNSPAPPTPAAQMGTDIAQGQSTENSEGPQFTGRQVAALLGQMQGAPQQ